MLASERLVYILNRLKDHPAVTIREMSQELDISEATVRRDLDELQRQGKLKRQHGGAVLNSMLHTISETTDWTISEKTMMNTEGKRKASELAGEMIQDGDCLYIDGGSTMVFLVPYLKNKRVHIVTPNLRFVRSLGQNLCSVQIIGGTYEPFFDMTVGSKADQAAVEFRYDVSFFGAGGIDPVTKEVYSATIETTTNKLAAMKNSLRNYMIVDSSKFTQRGFCYCCSTTVFDAIFSDDKPVGESALENLITWEEKQNEKK
jgi:DeoR/GlpR family transcriptional regulator of sugar metabolism